MRMKWWEPVLWLVVLLLWVLQFVPWEWFLFKRLREKSESAEKQR